MNLHRNIRSLIKKEIIFSMTRRNKTQTATEYCLDSIRQHDYENFVCTLLLKNTSRSCALAVRGFNIEVARVGEQVSQPTIALMRMQFWEDTLEKCFSKDFSKIPQHPVALQLHKVLSDVKLTKRFFKNLINSRKSFVGSSPFKDVEALEKYAEQSVSSVYYLLLEGGGVKSVHADHAASHLGKAQGIIQQLRAVPLAKQLNLISIPQDILIKNKVSEEEIIRGVPNERLNECVYEVASRAHQHLNKARSLLNNVPGEGRSVLLPAVAVDNYLTRLQKANYNVLHPSLRHRNWIWLPTLWYTHMKNKY